MLLTENYYFYFSQSNFSVLFCQNLTPSRAVFLLIYITHLHLSDPSLLSRYNENYMLSLQRKSGQTGNEFTDSPTNYLTRNEDTCLLSWHGVCRYRLSRLKGFIRYFCGCFNVFYNHLIRLQNSLKRDYCVYYAI